MAAPAARPPTMVIQDDYIDMDLTQAPTLSSPSFEFQSAGAGRREAEAFASPADELFYKGNLLPLQLPPRLHLVQRLLQEQRPAEAARRDAAAERRDAGAGAAKKPCWSRRLKVVKKWASRDYLRSLFSARPSDILVDGSGCGSVSARGSAPEQEEACHCHHRKSFSGIIRRVRLVAAAPGVSPLCSSSSSSLTSSSSSTPSCGAASGFFSRAATPKPALKRSSSFGSEEGAIQGAIAHCKQSQQQGPPVPARRSVSGVVFCSASNTPRASSGETAQTRQEMCRG